MRPSFITSKAERKNMVPEMVGTETFFPAFAGIFKVSSSLDMPVDTFAEIVFRFGSAGVSEVDGELYLTAVDQTSTQDVYKRPVMWKPRTLGSWPLGVIPDNQTAPVLNVFSLMREIEPLMHTLNEAWVGLRQNIRGMHQPPICYGDFGDQMTAEEMADSLNEWNPIKVKGRSSIPLAVADLQAKDYTRSFVDVINAVEDKILTILGIPGNADEKASGVTVSESESDNIKIELGAEWLWSQIDDWVEKTNAFYPGLSLVIEKNEKYAKIFEVKNDTGTEEMPV